MPLNFADTGQRLGIRNFAFLVGYVESFAELSSINGISPSQLKLAVARTEW